MEKTFLSNPDVVINDTNSKCPIPLLMSMYVSAPLHLHPLTYIVNAHSVHMYVLYQFDITFYQHPTQPNNPSSETKQI